MNLDRGAVQRYRLDPDANNLRLLQLLKHPIQHTAFAPAVHAGVDGVPIAEAFGQAAPLAAMLGHVQNGIQYAQIAETDIAPLERQTVYDSLVLGLSDFHALQYTRIHAIWLLELTGPNLMSFFPIENKFKRKPVLP